MKSLVLVLTLWSGLNPNAQIAHNSDFVVLSHMMEQLRPILQAATAMDHRRFEVFLNEMDVGKTTAPGLSEWIFAAQEQNINISVHNKSLARLGLSAEVVPSEITFADNAFQHYFRLRKHNYLNPRL